MIFQKDNPFDRYRAVKYTYFLKNSPLSVAGGIVPKNSERIGSWRFVGKAARYERVAKILDWLPWWATVSTVIAILLLYNGAKVYLFWDVIVRGFRAACDYVNS
jgi:hypothetical protein